MPGRAALCPMSGRFELLRWTERRRRQLAPRPRRTVEVLRRRHGNTPMPDCPGPQVLVKAADPVVMMVPYETRWYPRTPHLARAGVRLCPQLRRRLPGGWHLAPSAGPSKAGGGAQARRTRPRAEGRLACLSQPKSSPGHVVRAVRSVFQDTTAGAGLRAARTDDPSARSGRLPARRRRGRNPLAPDHVDPQPAGGRRRVG